jgi:hypothetical protein
MKIMGPLLEESVSIRLRGGSDVTGPAVLWDFSGRMGSCAGPGQVLHFSEDPTITEFVPHVAATAHRSTPYVRTVDAARARTSSRPSGNPNRART